MSLGVSPFSTPVHAHRPLPPSRSKRHSLVATPRTPNDESFDGSASRGEGVMGGLRERTEEELQRASREALESELRECWKQQDTSLGKINDAEATRRGLEVERTSLEQAILTLQSRHEDALNEQNRLEADLQGRSELLERLRRSLADAERQVRDGKKRAFEQEKSIDAERAALQSQEAHLQQRIKTLLSARSIPPPSHSTHPSSDSRAMSDLQEELATLNVSHSTLLAQINTLTSDIHGLRQTNADLQEENQGWEFLVRERTLSGKVRENGGLFSNNSGGNGNGKDDYDNSSNEDNNDDDENNVGRRRRPEREHSIRSDTTKSEMEALDEELEMDELHSDLEAQSPILGNDLELGRVMDRPQVYSLSPDQGHLSVPMRRRRPKGENLGDVPVTGSGLDLAAELGRAEVDLDGNEMRVLGKGDEGEALRADVKNLREANKALTLYCSKIIDRIIAQEGFEHILAVDYKTHRLGTRSRKPSRGNLRDITSAMQANTNVQPVPAIPTPTAAASSSVSTEVSGKDEMKKEEPKKARPLSMMVRAISGPGENGKEVSETKPEQPTDRRGRRGFSIDFRSLGFGSSTPSLTETETKPNLKPLKLASRASATSTKSTAGTVVARKLDVEEEDEEDKRERHHLEATLKLMGVERLPSESPSITHQSEITNRAASRSSLESTRRSSMSPENGFRKTGSPLSRLSSALGVRTDSPLSTMTPEDRNGPLSPEHAAAALKAFDHQEAQRALALSQGRAVTGYTTPSIGSIRRTKRRVESGERGNEGENGGMHRSRSQSTEMEQIGGKKGNVVDHGGPGGHGGLGLEDELGLQFRESGSASTLWSLGSSRPSSGEVVKR